MQAVVILVLGALTFCLTGCTSSDAASKFCGSAAATFTAGNAIFDDLKQSCLREVSSRQELGEFAPPIRSDPGCSAIGTQADAAKAAAEILSDYFSAINGLASFDTGQLGTNAGTLAEQGSKALSANSTAQSALKAIASVLVHTATAGYQKKKLAHDLLEVREDVPKVLDGLITIIQNDYIGESLGVEERKTATRYKEFLVNNSKPDGAPAELKLSLYDRWRTDQAAIEARRKAARNLVAGLQTISKGFSVMAANANKVKSGGLTQLLSPYTTQLETLIPLIQKGS